MEKEIIEQQYGIAKDIYASIGVDTDHALEQLESVSLSLQCWQGDDVGGFEHPDAQLSGGGIQATGNYPGKAHTIEELRSDLLKALSLIPGSHRVNLHAMYGEFGGQDVDRNEITPEHFEGWVNWAKDQNLKLDFNSTCFSHPKAAAGFTLSSKDPEIRRFWIQHVQKCREITAYFGAELGSPSIHDLWIPDGMKDLPVDRMGYRNNLKQSLDEIYGWLYPPTQMKDAVEGKLFGLGYEAFTVGSHDFYLGYAATHNLMLCMDMGHYHPTENVGKKISAILPFTRELLLHVSRGVHWDSDHVVIFNDELRSVAEEIVRCEALDNIYLALDYFDASINRIGAWVIGDQIHSKSVIDGIT